MGYSLILDTSSERGIVALAKGEQVIETKELPFGLQSSTSALKEIEAFGVDSLFQIIVGVGPGSYTGIRVAASIAKSLSYAKQIPLIGVSALQAFTLEEDVPSIALLDAKIGGVYLSYNGESPMLLSLEELRSSLRGIKHFVGPCLTALKEKLSLEGGWYEQPPSAQKMLELAWNKPKQIGDVELLYLQEWKPQYHYR